MPSQQRPFGTAGAAETHVSTVFFAGDRAYKLLKPVTTAFLDFAPLERRIEAVDEEFHLNRRLAPDVYLGTGDVREGGELVDRMLVMRRLHPEDRLSLLLDQGEGIEELRAVVRAVAAFHEGQEPLPAHDIAGPEALQALWDGNTAELRNWKTTIFDPRHVEEAEFRSRRWIEHSADLLAERIADGFVRDGHGDLRAEDIFCEPDGPRILDCLAFEPRMRIGDVVNDIAFLAMDVERFAGPEVAATVWRDYEEFTNEQHPVALAHFYVAYRAHVRAKIEALRYAQGVPYAAAEARSHLDLALFHLRAACRRLVVLGGGPASGKSTVAGEVAGSEGWVVLSSDELRKDLTGRDHLDHRIAEVDSDIYSPEVDARVYAELIRRASELLERGESVIIDASFDKAAWRSDARSMAEQVGAEVIEIECVLDTEKAIRRAERRLAVGDDPSDARPGLIEELTAGRDPWPEAHRLSTVAKVDVVVARAKALMTTLAPVAEALDA